MTQLFIDSLKNLPKSKTKLLILPFQDTSQLLTPDTTLSKAFIISAYDLISTYSTLFHPYIAFQSTQNTPHDQLFDTQTGLKMGQELGATHVVMGQFQKYQENSIRVFIKVLDVSSNKATTAPLEFITQESDRFFSVAGDIAQTILEQTTQKKIPQNLLATYLKTSPSFGAFRYYIKGLEKAARYNATDLEIAKAWFEKAAALSYGYQDALTEKKRVLWMLSLYNRQMGKDISLWMTELNQEGISVENAQKKYEGSSKITYQRWQKANELYMLSINTPEAGAVQLLEQAKRLTPEDGILTYELAKRTKQNAASSEQMLLEAKSINPCLDSL